MKLHANAALSLQRRRALARRVVEEDWSLTKAAQAAGLGQVQVALRRGVGHHQWAL
jgi:hypothetical protein